MKVPPASTNWFICLREPSSSASRPKVIVPRHTAETTAPLLPSFRYSMSHIPFSGPAPPTPVRTFTAWHPLWSDVIAVTKNTLRADPPNERFGKPCPRTLLPDPGAPAAPDQEVLHVCSGS